MAASQNILKIGFKGKFSELSISVNGKTLHFDELKGNGKKNRSPKQIQAQKDHSFISKFAGRINRIPVLKRVWHKFDYEAPYRASVKRDMYGSPIPKKTTPFNKIMAANRKVKQDIDHPNEYNPFVPTNADSMPAYSALLLPEELIVNINFVRNNQIMDFSEKEKKITGAALFSAYNPKRKSNTRFEVFSKWNEIKEFTPSAYYRISFPVTSEEQEILKKYKDCYFYFTIVTETETGRIIRCFSSRGVTSSLKDFPVSPVQFTNEPK
jgi:hypothetical protein